MTTTFAPDALLGLEIDEHMDEPEIGCEGLAVADTCARRPTWMSVCPLCGHGYAWCDYHRALFTVHCKLIEASAGPRHKIVCPPEHGGCGGLFAPAAMIFRPIR